MLLLEPGGAEPELGAAAGEHVERRHRLRQQTGMAVGDPGDQQAEPDALGLGGDVAERRVALQHRFLPGADRRNLEPVVHQRELLGAALLGGAGGRGEVGGDALGAAGVGEGGVVDRKLQGQGPSDWDGCQRA